MYYYRETCTSFDPSGGGGCKSENCGPSDPESIPTIPIEGDPDWDTGAGGGSPAPTPEVEIIFKVERDSSFREIDKINCTYERLMEQETIPQALVDFFGEDALFDVTFNVVENLNCNNKPNATGCTTPLPGDAYRIDIDKDYINDPTTPTIFLAQTLIHESFHAKLYAEVKKNIDSNISNDIEFIELYNKYRQHENWTHEIMAKTYTDMMQKALKEVHPQLNDSGFLNGYDDNSLWDWNKFYEYVSYRGLEDTQSGVQYFSDPNSNISLYLEDTKTNSTKTPNCN